MESLNQSFEIESIIFESDDTTVLCKGIMHKEHMNFKTDLIISQTQLNEFISSFQQKNPDQDFNNFLCTEPMYNGEILFSATLPAHLERGFSINNSPSGNPIRQIRA